MENIKNENGMYVISLKAYKDIAEIACKNVKNIAPAKTEDFVTCKKDKKGSLLLDVSIKVKQGVDLIKTCQNLQDSIHENILLMTGTECKDINIDITGFIKK